MKDVRAGDSEQKSKGFVTNGDEKVTGEKRPRRLEAQTKSPPDGGLLLWRFNLRLHN
jgi:hypothetical protein